MDNLETRVENAMRFLHEKYETLEYYYAEHDEMPEWADGDDLENFAKAYAFMKEYRDVVHSKRLQAGGKK